jgi:hypothetical protein
MAEFSGRGDPVRSMELLWGVGDAPTRGRKPGLTVAVIVAAAIELADAEGLAIAWVRAPWRSTPTFPARGSYWT